MNMKRQIRNCLFVLATLACTAVPVAHGEAERADKRWREDAHGLSFVPPLRSRLVKQTGQESSVTCVHDDGFRFEVFIRQSKDDATVDMRTVRNAAIQQMNKVHPSLSIIEQHMMTVANRPAALIYFFLPATKKGQWVTGHFFIQLEEHIIANIVYDVPRGKYENTRAIFEEVINSIEVDNPAALQDQRAKMLQNGIDWRKANTPRKLAENIIPEQWFRIIENDQDVGYMVVRQSQGPLDARAKVDDDLMRLPGIRVDVQARFWVGDRAFDILSNFFVSDNGEAEVWSIRSTERAAQPDKVLRLMPARGNRNQFEIVRQDDFDNKGAAETWVRGKDGVITLVRRLPSGTRQIKWKTPPVAYVSQAELYLLAPALPVDNQPVGLYAYYPNEGEIALRTERAKRLPNGHIQVTSKLTPDMISDQVTIYRADGRIVRRDLPGGRVMVPTDLRELRAVWRFKK